MLTRRTAIGAGLAFASAACAAGLGPYDATVPRRREARAIDALLVDENIETPLKISAFIKASGQAPPALRIRLDAADQAGLMDVFDKSRAVVGLSSGATLFCLERIAWDYGFRLTERTARCSPDPDGEGYQRDLAALLSGPQARGEPPSPLTRAYRPSRADGTLHAWVMEKSVGPQVRQRPREA